MRYEILYEYGGIYVDADSASARPLDDWLLDTRMFAIWENENHRPGLVANGFIGSIPGHPALDAIIQKTSIMNEQVWRRNYKKISWKGMRPHIPYEPTEPWITVGPVLFTKTIMPFCPLDVTILPSILFLPKHYLDKEERKTNWTYATHEWGNTFKTY